MVVPALITCVFMDDSFSFKRIRLLNANVAAVRILCNFLTAKLHVHKGILAFDKQLRKKIKEWSFCKF